MDDSHAQKNDGLSVRQGTYAHGYDSALTLEMHARRTATKQAGWFMLHLRPGMTLLDCGCATGSITLGLAEAVKPGEVVGVDLSEVEIERAQARAAAAGITNICFVVGDIYQLDFVDNHFDAIFSHNVLEHVGEPERALAEMARVLKPGGLIGIRNTDSGGILVTPINEQVAHFLSIFEEDWRATGGHPRLGRELGGLLSKAGFIDIEASASYESYSGPEGRKFIANIVVSRLTESDFVERVLQRGWATADELETIKDAWLGWQTLPNAFLAIAHGEVVGRKP